jgi:hypothetical protein
VQPKIPYHAAAVSSSADVEILGIVHDVISRAALHLIFDCKDFAGNVITAAGSSSTRVSSFLLTAPRPSANPVWCCSEKDLVASVTQDLRDKSFTSSASFFTPGNNYIVPAVISAGAFYVMLTHSSWV